MLVLLSSPGRAVPELSIAFVATVHSIGASVCLKLCRVAEDGRIVTRAIVWLVVDFRIFEAIASRGHPVVLRLMIGGSIPHSTGTIPATSHLHRNVFLWNQFSVETCGGEIVLCLVEHLLTEYLA